MSILSVQRHEFGHPTRKIVCTKEAWVPSTANPHGTLDYSRLPELWAWLDTRGFLYQTKLAIKLLVLSAHRVSVVLAARWEHLDIETGVWTVPAKTDNETKGLMKSGRAHVTTLPMPFIEELKQLKGSSPFIYPSATGRGHVTQNALLKALKEFDETITAHGFRNTFKTWARSEGVPDWIADAYPREDIKLRSTK